MCARAQNCSDGDAMSAGTIILLTVSVLVLAYLTLALLKPEKF
jgi:K+-transporting ATPase KdpF subunit